MAGLKMRFRSVERMRFKLKSQINSKINSRNLCFENLSSIFIFDTTLQRYRFYKEGFWGFGVLGYLEGGYFLY